LHNKTYQEDESGSAVTLGACPMIRRRKHIVG
jgi:hypothetical protein